MIRKRFCTASFLFAVGLLVFTATTAHAVEIIRDTEIENTLKTFAKPLFEQAGIPENNINFVIIKDSEINAFVAGGMNMFLYTGLLLDARNPLELAGVMAHETSHIASGHLLRSKSEMEYASAQTVITTLLGIAAAIGTGKAEAAVALSSGGKEMALRQFLRHSRDHESSADQGAIGYLNGAGVSSQGMLSFLDRMSTQELLPESQQTEYIRTHPLTYDRVAFVRYVVQQSKLTGAPTPKGWDQLHATMIAKLTAYLYPDRAFQLYAKKTPLDLYAQAIAYYRKNAFIRSIDLCNQLIAGAPENPYFYELKGQVLFDSGNIADSIIPYRKAVELLPSAALIRVALAHSLLESRSKNPAILNEAITNLARALQLEPKMAWAHRLLATAYGRQKNEGMAQLHLAEEALLQNRLNEAETLASLAQKNLPKANATGWNRSRDILDYVHQLQKKKADRPR